MLKKLYTALFDAERRLQRFCDWEGTPEDLRVEAGKAAEVARIQLREAEQRCPVGTLYQIQEPSK